jgi:hypothetical protein
MNLLLLQMSCLLDICAVTRLGWRLVVVEATVCIFTPIMAGRQWNGVKSWQILHRLFERELSVLCCISDNLTAPIFTQPCAAVLFLLNLAEQIIVCGSLFVE